MLSACVKRNSHWPTRPNKNVKDRQGIFQAVTRASQPTEALRLGYNNRLNARCRLPANPPKRYRDSVARLGCEWRCGVDDAQ